MSGNVDSLKVVIGIRGYFATTHRAKKTLSEQRYSNFQRGLILESFLRYDDWHGYYCVLSAGCVKFNTVIAQNKILGDIRLILSICAP